MFTNKVLGVGPGHFQDMFILQSQCFIPAAAATWEFELQILRPHSWSAEREASSLCLNILL